MGLGNPGPGYAVTRHNAGFMAADVLARAWSLPAFKRPLLWRARVSRGAVGTDQVVVVKPQTYMNRSGRALGPLLKDPAFDPSTDLLVLVDEVALPLGTFRIRPRGSAGGHNGLRSIAGRLMSEDYARLRIGIGPRPDDIDQTDFVLGRFESAEHDTLMELLPTVTQAVECWVREDLETAMNRYNRRGAQSD